MANLTQLRMLEGLSGFIPVDKPAGLAFSTVVKTVKRKFNLVKVGHGGSLDAMASGLLVLLVGDANAFAADVMGADRSYVGTMTLGLRTNTGDVHGAAVGSTEAVEIRLDDDRLKAALRACRGDVFQTEPRFCSVRREGSADYEIADTGAHEPFLAHVYRFEVEPGAGSANFRLDATKSLLVRALVADFGEALGCGACLASLRRTKVGALDVADAVSFDRLLETEMADFASLVQPVLKLKG